MLASSHGHDHGIPTNVDIGRCGTTSRRPAGSCFTDRATPRSPQADTDSPSASTFLAAFTSAFSSWPQVVHRKTAWLSRLSGSTVRHAEQRCDVYAAGTFTMRQPVWRATVCRANSSWCQPPSEHATATVTPRSTPTAEVLTCRCGVTLPSSTRNATNQSLPSLESVTDLTSPPRARDQRNLTRPSFGSLQRPHLRPRRCTITCSGSGNRNDGDHFALDRQLIRHVPCARHARSRSMRVCCNTCDGAAWSHRCSCSASASSAACCR